MQTQNIENWFSVKWQRLPLKPWCCPLTPAKSENMSLHMQIVRNSIFMLLCSRDILCKLTNAAKCHKYCLVTVDTWWEMPVVRKQNTWCVSIVVWQPNGTFWKLWRLIAPPCLNIIHLHSYHISLFSTAEKSHLYTEQKSWASGDTLFFTMKVVSVFQSFAECVLFFLCLTSHRLLPLPAESRLDLLFFCPLCVACLWCDILVLTLSLSLWERKKNLQKKRSKRQKCSKVAQPSTHWAFVFNTLP